MDWCGGTVFTPACRGCGGVSLFFIKPPPRRKTGVSAEICRIWFIGVSLLILIALKPSVEYLLLTVDFFSAVPHTLQLTLCSHSMRGVLALTFLAPSDSVEGRIMFTMSQVHVQSPPHSPLPSLPLIITKVTFTPWGLHSTSHKQHVFNCWEEICIQNVTLVQKPGP